MRNEWVWSRKTTPLKIALLVARTLLQNWQQVRAVQGSSVSSSLNNGPSKWSAPQAPYRKLNTDATLFNDVGCSGFGYILRDMHGTVEECCAWTVQHLYDPTIAKALCIREALS